MTALAGIVGAQEDFRKISPQIPSQFSEYIRGEGPGFVAFVQAYFEYLEQEGYPVEQIMGLRDSFDIDRTTDKFVEYFRREFLTNIPVSVLADKRLLAKHIRDFYRTRGSKSSYRFLFRALFDKEIEFYYPGEDVLRASDGRWSRETVIRVGTPFSISPRNMEGLQLTGLTSGAKGQVQQVLGLELSGLRVFEMTLERVTGAFVDGEIVRTSTGETAAITNTIGAISNIRLEEGYRGAYHQSGDIVQITGVGATSANGQVSATSDRSALTFRIVNPGSGYRIANTTISLENGLGQGARFSITAISNTQNLTLGSDKIAPFANIPLNTGQYFITGGGNTAPVSANMATANVTSVMSSVFVFANVSVGSISQITLDSVGYGYDRELDGLPTVRIVDQEVADAELVSSYYGGYHGRNAVIVANNAPGALTGIQMNQLGANFNKNEALTLTNTTRGISLVTDTTTSIHGHSVVTKRNSSYAPVVTATVSGVTTLPGRYTDTKGYLSWNNRLQDNDFYQQFAYVIKVSELVETYRTTLKKMLHPAGTKFFGFYTISSFIDTSEFFAVSSPEMSVSISSESQIDISVASDYDVFDEEVIISDHDLYLPSVNSSSYVAIWKQAPNYMKIETANSVIAAYAALAITPYAPLPISFFDGTPRLLVSTTGTAWYANGALLANAGSISVGGPGSNLMIVDVSGAVSNGMYSVNAIFSNTTLSIRLNYAGGDLSNGYFFYQTS